MAEVQKEVGYETQLLFYLTHLAWIVGVRLDRLTLSPLLLGGERRG
jgi:hypothetical protein